MIEGSVSFVVTRDVSWDGEVQSVDFRVTVEYVFSAYGVDVDLDEESKRLIGSLTSEETERVVNMITEECMSAD